MTLKVQVVNLPKVVKPETGGEENKQQPSGLPGWLRAAKDEPRNLGDPGLWVGPNAVDENISRPGQARESAGPIVVKKRSNARGAKGPYRG